MAPRTYALDVRTHPDLPPVFVWSFDSPWLRAAALRENPDRLVAVRRADIAHRVLRAHRRGDWRDVAPGVRVYLHDLPPLGGAFPAVPRLRLPNPREPPFGTAGRGSIEPRWGAPDAPRQPMASPMRRAASLNARR